MTSTTFETPCPAPWRGAVREIETDPTDGGAYGRSGVRRVKSRVDIGHETDVNGRVKKIDRTNAHTVVIEPGGMLTYEGD